jgi:hypothetical protein
LPRACRRRPELLALLDVLAENGALFDLPNKIDDTPLHEAAVGGESARCSSGCSRRPAVASSTSTPPNRFGDTPLHKAARAGNADGRAHHAARRRRHQRCVRVGHGGRHCRVVCAHARRRRAARGEWPARHAARTAAVSHRHAAVATPRTSRCASICRASAMGNRFTPRHTALAGLVWHALAQQAVDAHHAALAAPQQRQVGRLDAVVAVDRRADVDRRLGRRAALAAAHHQQENGVLRRPSPSTSNASSASNSGVWKKEFLVEPDAALDGDYVRSMLEKVDAEIASAGTDNSDDDDAIGEPAVTAAAATANSPTKDNASAATSATPPKKSEQEARNANAAAPQQPQAATGDAPQKKGSNRRRRRHRRPDDLPESATPAAVGATARRRRRCRRCHCHSGGCRRQQLVGRHRRRGCGCQRQCRPMLRNKRLCRRRRLSRRV